MKEGESKRKREREDNTRPIKTISRFFCFFFFSGTKIWRGRRKNEANGESVSKKRNVNYTLESLADCSGNIFQDCLRLFFSVFFNFWKLQNELREMDFREIFSGCLLNSFKLCRIIEFCMKGNTTE